MRYEILTAACPNVCSTLICSPSRLRLPSAQSGDPEGRPALALKLGPSNPEGPPDSAFHAVLRGPPSKRLTAGSTWVFLFLQVLHLIKSAPRLPQLLESSSQQEWSRPLGASWPLVSLSV